MLPSIQKDEYFNHPEAAKLDLSNTKNKLSLVKFLDWVFFQLFQVCQRKLIRNRVMYLKKLFNVPGDSVSKNCCKKYILVLKTRLFFRDGKNEHTNY